MASTITDTFKFKILNDLLEGITNPNNILGDSDKYYIGIGRSQEWPGDSDSPSIVTLSRKEERDFRLSAQSFKEVLDVSFIAPRYNWSIGSIYSQYDDRNHSNSNLMNPYYILTDESNVFICVKVGKNSSGQINTSTVKPTNTSGDIFELPDGYCWKFLYNIGSFSSNRYLASNFQPVALVTDSGETPSQIQQKILQESAVPGQVLSIIIEDRGNSYSIPPNVTIYGDGSGARAYAAIDSASGTISNVYMKDSAEGPFTFGSNYNQVSVSLSQGNAKLRAVLSPRIGLGADPRKDLNSSGLMFNAKPTGNDNGDFIINQTFRQVGLLLNPLKDNANSSLFTGDSEYSESTGLSLRYLKLNPGSVNLSNAEGQIVSGDVSQAQAYVDFYDEPEFKLYVHQTEESSLINFQEAETLSFSDGTSSASLVSSGYDSAGGAMFYTDIDKFSGELLYIDNRSSVFRDAEQTEDIKIVIQI